MKLIRQISYRYIFISAGVILLCTPILFFLLQKIMLRSLDEVLVQQKTWVVKKMQNTAIGNLNTFNDNIRIQPGGNGDNRDSFFYRDIYIPDDKETVAHRVLLTNITASGNHYQVWIQKSIVETDDLIQSILLLMLLLLAALLTGLFFINRYLSKKIWQPFYQTLDQLHRYRIDKNASLRLQRSKVTEFNELNQALEQLTGRNYQLYLQQKEFTENAAHELQTPLAVILANIDLLLQKMELDNEKADILENILNAGHRMQRINKALLLLAKIDNDQYQDLQEVNLTALTAMVIRQYEEAIMQKKITIATNLETTFITLLNPGLAAILITNLLTNAIRHTPEEGAIHVLSEQGRIVFSNTAAGSLALDKQKLFKRFQKQTPDSDSIGLGLSICSRICQGNGLQLTYRFEGQLHCFILTK